MHPSLLNLPMVVAAWLEFVIIFYGGPRLVASLD